MGPAEEKMGIYLSLFLAFFASYAYGQVRGSILDPAAPALNPMDPNGDGFITASGSAFVGPLDHSEFELPFLPLSQYEDEPGADNQYAPGCEFYELIAEADANVYPGYYYFRDPDGVSDNGDELIFFRFRVARFSNGATAFSILIDEDYRFGFEGAEADRNAVQGNPGFEKEVVILNHTGSDGGVWVLDVDGTAKPSLKGFHGALSAYYQVSYALNQDPACSGRVPVFVDMYVPFTALGISSTTQLRMAVAANEDIASSLGGGASDVGGVDGIATPDDDDQFIAVITNYAPVRVDQPANIAPLSADATLTIDENTANGFYLHTVTAQDANGDAVVFSIAEGNTDNAFSIDPMTGALTIINSAALDREKNSSFVLLVQASDGSLYDNAVIVVNLNDLNDNAPSLSDISIDIPENTANESVVHTLAASDSDITGVLKYEMKGGTGQAVFNLDGETGVITVADVIALDFETTASFTIVVEVSDGLFSDQAEITINVSNVNEPPTVTSASLTLEHFTESDIVHTVNATDPDVADVLTFSMQAEPFADAFAIDPQTGQIVIVDQSAPSTAMQFELVVTATDVGGLSGEGVVDVTLLRADQGIAPEKGFSPNGDTFNDYWLIRGIEDFPGNHVKVFNRWGHLVYEVSGYDNSLHRWQGEVAGDNAALENTYFFIITVAALRPMTGYVIVKP